MKKSPFQKWWEKQEVFVETPTEVDKDDIMFIFEQGYWAREDELLVDRDCGDNNCPLNGTKTASS